MARRFSLGSVLILTLAGGGACSSDVVGEDVFGSGGSSGTSTTGGTTTTAGPGPGSTTGASPTTSSTGSAGGDGGGGSGQGGDAASSSSGGNPCDSGPDEDRDEDGFTTANGDCNDCNAAVNPGAIEVVSTEPGDEPQDDDCDGRVDNLPDATCDDGLALDSTDAEDGARAIEICKVADGPDDWGLVSATYVGADGTAVNDPLQYGLQAAFGPNVSPGAGSSLLTLSTGRARLPGQDGACNACDCGGIEGATPDAASFPQTSPECGGGPGTPVFDDVALEVRLRAPTNATGFSFDFSFYTFEYPDFVCSAVNDQFIAWMQPPPAEVPNGNISFDATGNPISVNAAFFQVCSGCVLGEAQLLGTGFDAWTCAFDDGDAGATGWLRTQAPVVGGEEITLRFAIWDTGDGILDSTILLDSFRWIANGRPVDLGTVPVPREDDPG